MNKKLNQYVIICILFVISNSTFVSAQMVINISPNFNSGSIYIGQKNNTLSPYFGLQYFNSSYTLKQSNDNYQDIVTKKPFFISNEIPANLYIICLGLKKDFKKTNNTSIYLNANIGYVIVNSILNQSLINDATFVSIERNSDVFKFDFGLGMEHSISNNFSIGFEFGIGIFRTFSNSELAQLVYNPLTNKNESVRLPINLKINQSIFNTKISLNYYFETNPSEKSAN